MGDDVARDVVGEPLAEFGETFDRANPCFLIKFTQCRRPGVVAAVDAALRHLPDMRFIDVLGPLRATAYEDEPGAIEHHDSDARAIGQILDGDHGRRGVAWAQLDLARVAVALMGASVKPRFSTVFAHMATRSIVTGNAAATATAMPLSRAMPSRRTSARSISTADGTVSSTRLALANAKPLPPAI